jgi:hypothetical protein
MLMSMALELVRKGRVRGLGRQARGGLTPLEESRLRRRLRGTAPSEPWVEAQIITRHEPMGDGRLVARRYFDSSVFPPGGRAGTAMRWCRQCGRYTPTYALQLIERVDRCGGAVRNSTLVCDECRIGEQAARHRELYEALPHLRPAGSFSFFRMADLFAGRKTTR